MTGLIFLFLLLAIVCAVVWFVFPQLRPQIVGAVTMAALFLASLLTGFANWLGGLGA